LRRRSFRKTESATADKKVLRPYDTYALPVMSGANEILKPHISASGDIHAIPSRRRKRQALNRNICGIVKSQHMAPFAPDVTVRIEVILLEHLD
jgi:hypothetical protein